MGQQRDPLELQMTARSNRAEVRNPIAGDEEVAAIMRDLAVEHPAAAKALSQALRRLAVKWSGAAHKSWDKSKPPMSRYHFRNAWIAREFATEIRALGVNALHLARAIPDGMGEVTRG
ncbi:MAG: hypothetical protein K0Q43_18 [Ramlibacter sp.]|jgi:hypothetical protein|nr:hypothetical protein [Ramlibacter sp.]